MLHTCTCMCMCTHIYAHSYSTFDKKLLPGCNMIVTMLSQPCYNLGNVHVHVHSNVMIIEEENREESMVPHLLIQQKRCGQGLGLMYIHIYIIEIDSIITYTIIASLLRKMCW